MIPNLYLGNGCFTKHPLKNGCLGFQVHVYLSYVFHLGVASQDGRDHHQDGLLVEISFRIPKQNGPLHFRDQKGRSQYITWVVPPAQQSPPRLLLYIFRFGDPNRNLHLPQASWEGGPGTTQCKTQLYSASWLPNHTMY